MAFPYRIPVPIRNFDHEVSGAVGNALAAKPAIGSETRRERKLLVLSVAHFGNCWQSFTHYTVAGRARTHPPASVIDTDSMRQGNIQNAARQTGYTIRNLFRIHFHGNVHGKKRDRKFLSCRRRRFLVDIGVGAAHSSILTQFWGQTPNSPNYLFARSSWTRF